MPKFYKLDYRKLSFREYWNLSPNWKGIVAWLMKVLGHPLQDANVYPHPSTFKECEVSEAQLPSEAAAAMAPACREIRGLGFHSPQWVYIPSVRGNVETIAGTFLHPSGQVIARVMYSKATSGSVSIVLVSTFLITPLKDGRQLVTTNQRPTLRVPGTSLVKRKIGAAPSVLHQLHMWRVRNLPPGAELREVKTAEQRDLFIEQNEREAFEFHQRRGLYVALTDEQLTEPQRRLQDLEELRALRK